MSTCLQKTLLLYAPVLLACVIQAARSRDHLPASAPSSTTTLTTHSSSDQVDFDSDTVDEMSSEHNLQDHVDSPPMRHSSNKIRRGGGGGGYSGLDTPENDLALWINEEQVNMLSGMFDSTTKTTMT